MGAFPIELMNIGNTDDAFSLTSCDPGINDSCQETKWPTRFKDNNGNEISSLILDSDENRELFYKKDMGILARNGFSFELSKRVLNLEADEFSKLIKLI